jgi:hypothetical protein
MSTSRLFSAGSEKVGTGFSEKFIRAQRDLAGPAAVPAGNRSAPQLTLSRQSETVGPTTGLDRRQDADRDSGLIGSFCGCICTACSRREGADYAAGDADCTGIAHRRVLDAAPGSTAAAADSHLSPLPSGARRSLPAVLPRPRRCAGVQRDLCAGIPAERHRDRAPHELHLAARLERHECLTAFARRRSVAACAGFDVA